jgi:hypothetical protein
LKPNFGDRHDQSSQQQREDTNFSQLLYKEDGLCIPRFPLFSYPTTVLAENPRLMRTVGSNAIGRLDDVKSCGHDARNSYNMRLFEAEDAVRPRPESKDPKFWLKKIQNEEFNDLALLPHSFPPFLSNCITNFCMQ